MKCQLLLILNALILKLCVGFKDTSYSIIKETKSIVDEVDELSPDVLHLKDEWASKYNLSGNGLVKTTAVCVLNVTRKDIQSCNETIVKVIIGIVNQTEPDPEENDQKHTIVVCFRNDVQHEIELVNYQFENFTINLRLCNNGPNITYDTLAVLAPEPLEDIKTDTPFIFYETMYVITDYKYLFPNSTTLITWKSAVITIKEFLKLMKWNRVAIISDESEFSEIFEKELISKLLSEDILYGVKQCSGRYCDFKKALTEFRKHDVKVIIANIDETNTEKLLNNALNINMGRDVHWIFRERLAKDLTQKVRYSYNIHVQPQSSYANLKKDIMVNINKVTGKIIDIYNAADKDYVKFGRDITGEPFENNVIAEVYSHIQSQKIATVTINGGIVKDCTLHSLKYYSVSPTGCTVDGDTFYKPCSDMYVIYIIVVLIMCLLFTLVILWFFDQLQRTSINYVNI